jgi:hypothetical protein
METAMRARAFAVIAGLAALTLAGGAAAMPCYLIIDRNDIVIFRDTSPPFDLSTANAPERAAMRKRGEHLLVADFDKCNAVGYISATTGGTTATVDEIVMQLRPAPSTSIGNSGSYVGPPGNAPAPR